jgi:hypothetical protein
MEDALRNKFRDKIYTQTEIRETKNPWLEIYKDSIINKTYNGMIPKIVYRYILEKAKAKFKMLQRESEKKEKKIEAFTKYVRTKLIN